MIRTWPFVPAVISCRLPALQCPYGYAKTITGYVVPGPVVVRLFDKFNCSLAILSRGSAFPVCPPDRVGFSLEHQNGRCLSQGLLLAFELGLEFADGFLRFLVFPGSYAFAPLFAYLLVGLLLSEDLFGYNSIAPEEFTDLQLIH